MNIILLLRFKINRETCEEEMNTYDLRCEECGFQPCWQLGSNFLKKYLPNSGTLRITCPDCEYTWEINIIKIGEEGKPATPHDDDGFEIPDNGKAKKPEDVKSSEDLDDYVSGLVDRDNSQE